MLTWAGARSTAERRPAAHPRILTLITERPATLGDILAGLRREFVDEDSLMPAMAVINGLLESGALAAVGAEATTSGWADPAEQARMLHDEAARQRSIGPAAVERWKRLYDVDFQPLLDASAWQPIQDPVEAETVSQWPPVRPIATLATIDFATFDHPYVTATTELTLDEPGDVNAVAVTFRADLFGEIEHTLDPWTWPLSSWATAVWVFPASVHVAEGELLRVEYRHHVPGHADGLTYELVAGPGN
ncbi:MAG: hypothetical protein WCA57_07290 [Ilumatobacteraceae bacterium]